MVTEELTKPDAFGNPSPWTHTEEHYKIEILVDDLFTESIWDKLTEDNVNSELFRKVLSDAILKGEVRLEPCTLCGSLEDFAPYDPSSDD